MAGTKLSGAGQIRSSNHLQAAAGAAELEGEFTGETLSDKFQALNVSIVQASAKILEAVHEIPKILKQPQSKRASDCGSRDYLLFHIQQQKTLEICTLDNNLYQTYKRVLRNQDKFRVILDEQEIDCSLATAWQVLSFKEEVQQMHPVTAKFLEEVLRIHPSQFHFRIDGEVGFSTTYQDDDQVLKYHGICDKAAYPDSWDAPSQEKPSTKDLNIYCCTVPILGAIEEKTLYQKKELKGNLAQLAAQMHGFVEACQKIHNVYPTRFPGLLIFAKHEDKPTLKTFCALCVLWSLNAGHETRLVSKLLATEREFCAGVEWWLQQCKSLQDFVESRLNQQLSETTPVENSFPLQQFPEEDPEDGSGKDQVGHVRDAGDLSAAIPPFSGKILTSRTLRLQADKQKYNFVPAINIPNWLAVCKASQMAHHWNRQGRAGNDDQRVTDENKQPRLTS